MPYTLPQFRWWHYTFVWLVILYLGVSWLNAELMHEMTHKDDVPLHFSLLVVTAILGTTKWAPIKREKQHTLRGNTTSKRPALDLL